MRPGEPEPDNRIDASNPYPVGGARVVPQTAPTAAVSDAERREAIDRYLANALSAKNAEEIELCEYAAEHARAAPVRQFALQTAADHRELANQLGRIVPPTAGRAQNDTTGTSPTQPTEGRIGANSELTTGIPAAKPMHLDATQDYRPTHPASSDASTVAARGLWNSPRGDVVNAMVDQLSDLDRRIENAEFAQMRDLVEEKTGTDFDNAFMSAAASAQIETIATLDVAQEASSSLRPIAREAVSKAQRNLELAQRVTQGQERIAKSASESSNR
jgi:predicted outer membrane protein